MGFLRSQSEQIVPALISAWPRYTRFVRRCFELLRQVYVNARYSPHYEMTVEGLSWLGERVAELQRFVEQVCRERLATSG